MSIASLITQGIGPDATIPLLVTDGYAIGAAPEIPPGTLQALVRLTTTIGGVLTLEPVLDGHITLEPNP